MKSEMSKMVKEMLMSNEKEKNSKYRPRFDYSSGDVINDFYFFFHNEQNNPIGAFSKTRSNFVDSVLK